MPLAFDRYNCTLTFNRDILATNPADPAVMDTHIIERQRKLILEESALNKEINKYLNAPPISDAKKKEELASLVEKLEELAGEPLTQSQRTLAVAGRLEELRETFKDFQFKGTTVFFWDKEKNRPMISAHQVLGFLKDAAQFWGRRSNLEKKNGTVLHMTKRGDPCGAIGYTHSIINQEVRTEEEFITFESDVQRDGHGDSKFLQRSLRAQTAQGPRVTLSKSEVIKAGAQLKFTFKIPKGSWFTEDTLRMLLDAGETIGFGQWRGAGHGCFTYELFRA